ncbi:hypothetical protein [Nevskia ramosa]|uniref:hypothetical protein n=1 Tax=Nevskia ramosa TaxID=64002 RepID=UPI0023550676|nr:hypothetical protein [Nevskia ramosa]
MKRLIVAALLAIALLVVVLRWWTAAPEPVAVVDGVVPSTTVARGEQAAPAAVTSLPPAVPAGKQSPGEACREGEVVITSAAGKTEQHCADSALASQTGSRRRYRYVLGRDAYLLIDTTAGAATRVEYGHRSPEYGCDGEACSGLMFGKPDFNGRQNITLSGTALAREAPVDDGTQEGPVTLTARLSALGNVGAVCDTGVTLNFSDNSYTRFCAFGGNGYGQGEDGLPVYSFSNVDGGVIKLRTDQAGAIRSIEMSGEGLRCVAAACAGASFSAPDARGSRTLALIGTQLHSADNSRSATLNGQLVLSGD